MRGGAREGVEGGTVSASVSDSSLVPVQFQVCEAVAGWILVQSFREGGSFSFSSVSVSVGIVMRTTEPIF